VLPVAAAISPVPGGVGPMTIAMLLANTFRAAARAAGLDEREPRGQGAQPGPGTRREASS